MSDIVDQPPPVKRPDQDPVWPMVIDDFKWQHPEEWKQESSAASVRHVVDDMQARDALGREHYGTPLTAGNGRDSLVDAYQELLDGAAYLKTELVQTTMPAAQLGQLTTAYRRTLDNILIIRWLLDARTAASIEDKVGL